MDWIKLGKYKLRKQAIMIWESFYSCLTKFVACISTN